ncbi:hypothetical protein ACHAWO_008920 [Cyclotella atomus]|uniref:DUF7733 domain-containing protein n=1 Tax=Cyclotella atomus TaxID=382360 RepID=A0ABD3QIH2_9STRA
MHQYLSILFLPLAAALSNPKAASSQHRKRHLQRKHLMSARHQLTSTPLKSYGKGSEIWPECNEESISLTSSFPGGVIPDAVQNFLDSTQLPLPTAGGDAHMLTIIEPSSTSSVQPRTGKRRAIKRTLKHLLHSAAEASSRRASSSSDGVVISKSPLLLAVLLIALQCVQMKHILSAFGASMYLVGMACWCAAPKVTAAGNGEEVYMSSLPPKGHVPSLISNPLGHIASSKLYRIWLRSGALLSLLLPILALVSMGAKDVYNGGLEGLLPINLKDAFNSIVLAEPMHGVAKTLIGGHVFLICCQILSEGVGRAALLPLPIRILIPVTYNALRLVSLHEWAFYPSVGEIALSKPLRILGIANLLYWYINLGVFLPVAVVRYLRSHFICVEASEVSLRKGYEGSAGLL